MAVQKTRFEQQVEEVLETFDFERVHRVMESLAGRGPISTACRPGRSSRPKHGGSSRSWTATPGVHGSGGLRASYKDDGTLSLKFILCESWSDLSEDHANPLLRSA